MRLLLFFFILLFSEFAFAQDFQWAKAVKGSGNDFSNYIEVDQNGNSYTLGVHQYSFYVEHDSGIIIPNIYNSQFGDGSNIFLIKKDSEGNHIWSHLLSEIPLSLNCFGVKIGSDGYLYVGYVNYKYDVVSYNILGTVIKFDLEGNEISRVEYKNLDLPQNGTLYMTSFDIDSENNIYIAGYFTGNIQLNLQQPEFDLNNPGQSYSSGFIIKTSNTGQILWTKVLEGGGTQTLLKIKSDDTIFVIIEDLFNTYIFSTLLSENGNIIWNKEMESPISLLSFNFDTGPNGNIAVLLKASMPINIDIDLSENENIVYGQDILIWYDDNGNILESATYDNYLITTQNVYVDQDNNTYLLGGIGYGGGNTIDLNPYNDIFNVSLDYYSCGFFSKFNADFSFNTAQKIGSSNNSIAPHYNCWTLSIRDLKISEENYYIAGFLNGKCDFNPSEEEFFIHTSWDSVIANDGFIMKIGVCEDIPLTGEPELSFCESQNSMVSDLTPNQSYIKWYDSITSTTPLENDVPLTNGQTYFASRQVGNCPESSERLEVLVTINPLSPEPQVLNQDLCYNTSLTLADINVQGANLSFYDSLTEENSLDITTPLNPDTVYYVTQNTTGCESNRVLIPLNLIITPVPTIDQQQNFCLIDNPSLYDIVVQGENIKWYNSNQSYLSGNTALTTSETLYVSQTIDDCESELFPVYVTITDTPIPQAETNQVLCIDSNPTLNDISIDGENIKWYDENGNILSQNTPITENRIIYATQTIDNCESLQIIINITLQNSLNTNDYVLYLCDENNDNSETVNLSDYNQYLINGGTIQNFTFSYYNSYQNALNETNPISNLSNYQSSTEIVYVRISSNTTVCFDISELSINLISLPEIPLTENIYYLCGDSPLYLQLPNNGNIDYVWFNGSTSTNITISVEGEYWVKAIKTENGISCESTHHFSVKKTEPIHIAEIKIDDWTDSNNTITILPYNENYVYSLDGFMYQNENYFENLSNGKYSVFVKDRGDCDEAMEVVYLLTYPKFFTPNGDGINDYWRIKLSQYQELLNVEIYDRYGKLITFFDKNSIGWDGKLNGRDLPATDYWFKITRVSDRKIIYRGHFSLIR
ncbi:MAG: T9SS type B sorting domain-containing protein [Flavobacteriaceae bacterium]